MQECKYYYIFICNITIVAPQDTIKYMNGSKNKNKNSRADSLFSIAVLSDRGIWNNSKDQYKFFLRCVRISAVLHVQTLIMKNLT